MKILLNGGGDTKKLETTLNVLDEIMDHNKPILYVPLAMDESKESYDDCYKWFSNLVSNIKVSNIEMVRSFEEFGNSNLDKYSTIFIGGGNTYKLLKGIKDYKIFDKINNYLNNNGIIIGCSAGAIIFGYDINSCLIMDPNDVNLEDTKGFNVLDGKSIFAHYTNEYTQEAHKKFREYLTIYSINNEEVIALPEEDTIFINDSEINIIGPRAYYEFNKGMEIKKTKENGEFFKK